MKPCETMWNHSECETSPTPRWTPGCNLRIQLPQEACAVRQPQKDTTCLLALSILPSYPSLWGPLLIWQPRHLGMKVPNSMRQKSPDQLVQALEVWIRCPQLWKPSTSEDFSKNINWHPTRVILNGFARRVDDLAHGNHAPKRFALWRLNSCGTNGLPWLRRQFSTPISSTVRTSETQNFEEFLFSELWFWQTLPSLFNQAIGRLATTSHVPEHAPMLHPFEDGGTVGGHFLKFHSRNVDCTVANIGNCTVSVGNQQWSLFFTICSCLNLVNIFLSNKWSSQGYPLSICQGATGNHTPGGTLASRTSRPNAAVAKPTQSWSK